MKGHIIINSPFLYFTSSSHWLTLPNSKLDCKTQSWWEYAVNLSENKNMPWLIWEQIVKWLASFYQVALVVKNLPANAGGVRNKASTPGSGRSPGGRHGNSLQYSCLENPTDRGAWHAAIHRVPQSRIWMKQFSKHTGNGKNLPSQNLGFKPGQHTRS